MARKSRKKYARSRKKNPSRRSKWSAAKTSYKRKHRIARMGGLGTLAMTTSRPEFEHFRDEVYDLRYPRVGSERHLDAKKFDALRYPIRTRRHFKKVYGRNPSTGLPIANLITSSLAGKCDLPYSQLSKIVYGEIKRIGNQQRIGDWIETPDGTTYELTFKPGRK